MHQQKMRHRARVGINNPYFKSLTKRLCKGFMRREMYSTCVPDLKNKCFGGNWLWAKLNRLSLGLSGIITHFWHFLLAVCQTLLKNSGSFLFSVLDLCTFTDESKYQLLDYKVHSYCCQWWIIIVMGGVSLLLGTALHHSLYKWQQSESESVKW